MLSIQFVTVCCVHIHMRERSAVLGHAILENALDGPQH